MSHDRSQAVAGRSGRTGVPAAVVRMAIVLAGWSSIVALGFAFTMPPSAERWAARNVYLLPDVSTPAFEVAMQMGTLTAVVALAGLAVILRRRQVAAGALLAGLTAWTIVKLMKALVERPRPTAALLDHVPRATAEGWAYPSGHAAVSAALAAVVVLLATKSPCIRWLAVAVAVTTALARVHIGVHWPLDVLAGAMVGVLAAWGIAPIARRAPRSSA